MEMVSLTSDLDVAFVEPGCKLLGIPFCRAIAILSQIKHPQTFSHTLLEKSLLSRFTGFPGRLEFRHWWTHNFNWQCAIHAEKQGGTLRHIYSVVKRCA
jgi:hypothetical protein